MHGRRISTSAGTYSPQPRPPTFDAGLYPLAAAFPFTIFVSAFLLFAVEPMMGKFLLPWFGGAPSLWTTCILFFQLLLLAGYGYAHLIGSHLRPRAQAHIHLGLVALCLAWMTLAALGWGSPIMPPASWKPHGPSLPIVRVLLLLGAGIGLPYFILSATAPLLQEWFGRWRRGASPYWLYALSNLGAMLGLIAYPFAVEPVLSLHWQAQSWYALYLVFAAGLAVSVLSVRGLDGTSPRPAPESGACVGAASSDAAAATQVLWIALPACASLLFLAVTNQFSEDVAPVPFLWVLPLGIYLLSFIVCFGSENYYRRAIFNPALAAAILLACALLYRSYTGLIWQIAVYSFLLACACMVCHGELVKLKPSAGGLTAFYLMISVGGALGGLFGALIAPLLFRGYWELQLSIWGCAALLIAALMRDRNSWIHERRPVVAFALLGAAVLLPELMFASAGKIASGLYYNVVAAGALIVGAAAIFARREAPSHQSGTFVPVSAAAGLLMLGSVLLSSITARLNNNLIAIRNFYGAVAVITRDGADPAWHAYVLRHGQIVHGVQFMQADKRRQPTAYFGPTSGIGLLMLHHPRRGAAQPRARALRVGVVGLGIGTIAAYGQPADYIRFYEINPAIIEVATKTDYFTYVRDSRARVDIIAGDARLSMEQEVRSGHPQRFDVLVIDAFSGDAIPVHLLTREAFGLYLDQLNPDGVVALHISNNYLDLRPVAARLARHFNLSCGWIHSEAVNRLTQTSDWVLLARNTRVLGQPAISARLRHIEADEQVPLWTDDYSNLLRILR